jgi:hypothetical protein
MNIKWQFLPFFPSKRSFSSNSSNDSNQTIEPWAKTLACDFEAYRRADEPDKEGTDRAISSLKG